MSSSNDNPSPPQLRGHMANLRGTPVGRASAPGIVTFVLGRLCDAPLQYLMFSEGWAAKGLAAVGLRASNLLVASGPGVAGLGPIPTLLTSMYAAASIRHLPPAVTTLDPRRLGSANYFDVSESPIRDEFCKPPGTTQSEAHSRQFGNQMELRLTKFPKPTVGFLYYHLPSYLSALAGGVRFRLASSADQHAFLAGTDLTVGPGLPWQIPITHIATHEAHTPLLDMLVHDGLTPRALIHVCRWMCMQPDAVLIAALGQSWTVAWEWEFSRIFIIAPGQRPVATLVRHPWYHLKSEFRSPYRGRGIVSLVKGPDGAFGLRVDKVIQLIQDSANLQTVVPAEGQVTPFSGREIQRSTKKSEEELNAIVGVVHSSMARLPWLNPRHDPLDVYRHSTARPSSCWIFLKTTKLGSLITPGFRPPRRWPDLRTVSCGCLTD
ncbi:hypothetical protein B0H10DRAFT_2208211 [Mycena sp. CBHHK59/15]|nr:hypothetical protein B0H10DRAFT_2208211 [Mycena sp. CBHHK59/15]